MSAFRRCRWGHPSLSRPQRQLRRLQRWLVGRQHKASSFRVSVFCFNQFPSFSVGFIVESKERATQRPCLFFCFFMLSPCLSLCDLGLFRSEHGILAFRSLRAAVQKNGWAAVKTVLTKFYQVIPLVSLESQAFI